MVASVASCIHNTVWRYLSGYQRHSRFRSGVMHDLRVYLAATFQYTKDRNLTRRPSTAFTLANTTEITLIQLNCAIKYFMLFLLQVIGNYLPQFAVKQCCTVGLNSYQIGS